MNLILTNLADALVLLKEYQRGCIELCYLIDAHIKRACDHCSDLETRRELLSVSVSEDDTLNKLSVMYRRIALEDLEVQGKVSVTNSKVLLKEDTVSFHKDAGIEEFPEDDVVVSDEEDEDEDEDEIEFSFEKV